MNQLTLAQSRRVHMVGIGGSGMGALASLLLEQGKQVSGSDVSRSSTTRLLEDAGATIFDRHDATNLGEVDYIVRSSAIAADNPEVVEAERRRLPNRKLAEAVGELMYGRSGVAVAGTHGKTTTTALVTWLLQQAGLDPLALIGADTPAFRLGARAGDGPMVVEADEYDRRFLNYWPEVVVVTSVEADHLDYYRDLAEIHDAFQALVQRVPEHGRLVVCADDPCAMSLDSHARRETYGFQPAADWRIDDYAADDPGRGMRFTLRNAGRSWPVQSPLIGEHNARNAAAAVAVADSFGVGLSAALAAIASFEAPRRRFQTRGRPGGIWLVDDYAHHPTKVRAVLRAASVVAGQVWVVFQPHTTNRTAALLDEFATSFGDATHALILPIYRPSGRELAARPIDSANLVAAIRAQGHRDVRLIDTFDMAEEVLREEARPGDLVITMGAGDVTLLADRLLEALDR